VATLSKNLVNVVGPVTPEFMRVVIPDLNTANYVMGALQEYLLLR